MADTIFRVGCDLYRKLSPDDREVTPHINAFRNKLPYDMIAQALAALHFKATGPDGKMFPDDIGFHMELGNKGVESLLKNVCGFAGEDDALISNIRIIV